MTKRAPILIVEDDQSIAELLSTMLQLAGYVTVHALDGGQAIDLLEATRRGQGEIGLIILDMLLPGITGLGLLRYLAQHAGGPPVLVLSGSPLAIETAWGLGVQATLRKPFNMDELLELVARLYPLT